MSNNQDLLKGMQLEIGEHTHPNDGMCAMELVSWLAGEKFSCSPDCVSFTIRQVFQVFNDNLPKRARARLLDYLPRIVGTAYGEVEAEAERLDFMVWFMIRDCIPTTLHQFAHRLEIREQFDRFKESETVDLAKENFLAVMTSIRSQVADEYMGNKLFNIQNLGMSVFRNYSDEFMVNYTPGEVASIIVDCQFIWRDGWEMPFRCIEGLVQVEPVTDGFSDTPEHLFHMARKMLGAPELHHLETV